MYRKIRYEVRWREYDAKDCQWCWHEQHFLTLKECKELLGILCNLKYVNRIIKHRIEIVKGLATFEG